LRFSILIKIKMIQRIQTIFLVLVALAFGSLFIKSISFGDFTQPETTIPASADGFLSVADNNLLLGFTVLGLLCAVVSIVLFKNRPLQIRIAWASVIAALTLIVLAGWELKTVGENYAKAQINDGSLNISGIGFIPLVLAMFFGFLAIRNIRKDELLVRSSDRLR
jgi:hypothetical protein